MCRSTFHLRRLKATAATAAAKTTTAEATAASKATPSAESSAPATTERVGANVSQVGLITSKRIFFLILVPTFFTAIGEYFIEVFVFASFYPCFNDL